MPLYVFWELYFYAEKNSILDNDILISDNLTGNYFSSFNGGEIKWYLPTF
jgi:hypothetical protein